MVVADAREQVARQVEAVHRAEELVVDVREVDLDGTGKELVTPLHVEAPVDDAVDRVARGAERPPHVQEVVAQARDAVADLLRRPALDAVLELVDLVVQRVDEVQVVLGDEVGQLMRQLAGADAGRRPRGLHGLGRIEGIAALRRLPHRDEPLARRHEIDLLVEDPVLLAHAHRDEQDAEDVVVVPFEPRTRLVVVPGRPAEELERPVVDGRG